MGVDRPVDEPFVTLERQVGRAVDRERHAISGSRSSGVRRAATTRLATRCRRSSRPGAHRLRIHSAAYDLQSRPFTVRRSRGAEAARCAEAQARAPARRRRAEPGARPRAGDPLAPDGPAGGQGRASRAASCGSWRAGAAQAARGSRGRRGGCGREHASRSSGLRDKYGNRIAGTRRECASASWRRSLGRANIGTGDGRTPGALGDR